MCPDFFYATPSEFSPLCTGLHRVPLVPRFTAGLRYVVPTGNCFGFVLSLTNRPLLGAFLIPPALPVVTDFRFLSNICVNTKK